MSDNSVIFLKPSPNDTDPRDPEFKWANKMNEWINEFMNLVCFAYCIRTEILIFTSQRKITSNS